MDIEKSIGLLKVFRNYNKFYKEENKNLTITITLETKESIDKAIERLLTAYEKEKAKVERIKDKLVHLKILAKIENKDIDRIKELEILLREE